MKRENILDELTESLFSIKRQLVTAGHCHSDNIGVTPAQAIILHIIQEKEGIGIKEISESLGTTSSATTQLVDALVNKGLLIKRCCADDKRAIKLALTENCKINIMKIRQHGIKKIQALFSSLSDQELEQFAALSKKVTKNINIVKEKESDE